MMMIGHRPRHFFKELKNKNGRRRQEDTLTKEY